MERFVLGPGYEDGPSEVVVGMYPVVVNSLFNSLLHQAFGIRLLVGCLGCRGSQWLFRSWYTGIGTILFGDLLGDIAWCFRARQLGARLRQVRLVWRIAAICKGKLRGTSVNVRFAELACSLPFHFDAMQLLCHAGGSHGNRRGFVGDVTDPEPSHP